MVVVHHDGKNRYSIEVISGRLTRFVLFSFANIHALVSNPCSDNHISSRMRLRFEGRIGWRYLSERDTWDIIVTSQRNCRSELVSFVALSFPYLHGCHLQRRYRQLQCSRHPTILALPVWLVCVSVCLQYQPHQLQ